MEIDERIEHNPITSGSDLKGDELMTTARNGFIRKVYAILGIQLTVTVFFVLLTMFNAGFARFQEENIAIFYIALVVSLIAILVLACIPRAATHSPTNVILLGVFTLAESYMVAMICSLYTPESVLNAAVATLGATLGLTFYAIKTKTDFSDTYSKCYGTLLPT
jgi:protein lifeguard